MSGIPHTSKDSLKRVILDPTCITPLPGSHLLNHYGIRNIPFGIKNIRSSPQFWHKFTVFNENYSCSEYPKSFILKAIIDFVYPCELLPVYVTQKANRTFFLARDCLDAIIKLCESDLSVPNSKRPNSPFKINIIKDVANLRQIPIVNLESNIEKVLQKRLTKDIINLSEFSKDEELHEYFSLALPSFLLYVFSLMEKLQTSSKIQISHIILSDNDIKHLPDFKNLNTNSIKSINLSNNKIQSIEDIVPLKDLPNLVCLSLEGNPLCQRFDSGFTYLLYVRTVCRKLTTLDNTKVITDGLYIPHKTFLCDTDGFDLANQFLEQYFTAFDERDRSTIDLLYSENAIFSMTYRELRYFRDTKYFRDRREEFKDLSRNLLDNSNKIYNEMICYGKRQISERLRGFPYTTHHYHTFTVDLMVYSKRSAVLSVSGLFKHYHVFNCGFTRSFVLSSKDGKEWLITNDMFHIYIPFNSNKVGSWPIPKPTNLFPVPSILEHKCALARTFESITGMNYDHSNTFLERNNWNLELALEVFIDEHINEEIPYEVFNERRVEKKEESDDDEVVLVTEDDLLPPIETLVIETPKVLPKVNTTTTVN